MRLIFLGTPRFAVPALEAIVDAGHRVEAVYTQPDRPKGRGQSLALSPVKEAALRLGLAVHQPERIRRPESQVVLKQFVIDAMVVVGYGQIIPQAIIDMAPLGIINVHASLLPKYRGAAPVQWAVANGETVTGVTTMRINAGLDTGDMLRKTATEIGLDEDALELGERLAVMGASLLVETLADLPSIAAEAQDDTQATYAPILKKEDGLVDWSQLASSIHNRARGFLPWPGVYSGFRGQLLHIWKSSTGGEHSDSAPGTLLPQKRRLLVACGGGTTLELREIQMEGRNRISAEAFLNGQRLTHNERLGDLNH